MQFADVACALKTQTAIFWWNRSIISHFASEGQRFETTKKEAEPPTWETPPPAVYESDCARSGFVTSYFKRKEPCGSLFRQVLFVLQAVPDVLGRYALMPYKLLLIVLFQYTTHHFLSQARYYFESALSVSACFISIIRGLSGNRPISSFQVKKASSPDISLSIVTVPAKNALHLHLYFLLIKPPFYK